MSANNLLASYLEEKGYIKSENIIRAFKEVRREDFIPKKYLDVALADEPLPIGHGATISQPRTVALMLELLQPQAGDRVLDVGSGSGWTAALLASCVGTTGFVDGIDHLAKLVKQARLNLETYKQLKVALHIGNGYDGLPAKAPFDVIHVAAAAKKIPASLTAELADYGRLIIPIDKPTEGDVIGAAGQDLVLITKRQDTISTKRFPGFQFIPLVE